MGVVSSTWKRVSHITLKGKYLKYRAAKAFVVAHSGHNLGRAFEENFTSKAEASGLTDEEAKSAFNANMLSSGVLADGPAAFGKVHGRRWLVSEYEAGDVVLHNTFMVRMSCASAPQLGFKLV